MKRRDLLGLGAVAVTAVTSGAVFMSRSSTAPRPAGGPSGAAAERAPDFSVERLAGGETIRLASFLGEVLVLNFWATWCGPCRVEMPWLNQVYERYRGAGLRVLGVNMDDAGTRGVQAFVRDMRVSYTIAQQNDAIVRAYGGVRFLPQSMLIDRGGGVVKRVFGMPVKSEFEGSIRSALGGGTG